MKRGVHREKNYKPGRPYGLEYIDGAFPKKPTIEWYIDYLTPPQIGQGRPGSEDRPPNH